MAVYKDNNGTWYISVRYVNWKGEHTRKVKRGFVTKREAADWERNFLHENAGNLDMSFETFVDLYKKNLKERLKLSTWQTKVVLTLLGDQCCLSCSFSLNAAGVQPSNSLNTRIR